MGWEAIIKVIVDPFRKRPAVSGRDTLLLLQYPLMSRLNGFGIWLEPLISFVYFLYFRLAHISHGFMSIFLYVFRHNHFSVSRPSRIPRACLRYALHFSSNTSALATFSPISSIPADGSSTFATNASSSETAAL